MVFGFRSESRAQRKAVANERLISKYRRRLGTEPLSNHESCSQPTIGTHLTSGSAVAFDPKTRDGDDEQSQGTFSRLTARFRRKRVDQDQSSSEEVSLTPSQQLRLDICGQTGTEYKPEPYQQVMQVSQYPATMGKV